jgi:hypothetical protein
VVEPISLKRGAPALIETCQRESALPVFAINTVLIDWPEKVTGLGVTCGRPLAKAIAASTAPATATATADTTNFLI